MKRKTLKNFLPAIYLAAGVAVMPLSTVAADVVVNTPATPAPPVAPDPNARLSAPAREVVKLSAAGMSEDVVKAYIANSPATFNLTTDDLVHLQGVGVSSPVMAAMLTHDMGLKNQAEAYAANTPPSPTTAPQTAPYPANPVPEDTGNGYTPAPDTSANYTQPAGSGSWNYGDDGWYWTPYSSYVYYYPWGAFDWCFFPGRGWGWSQRGGFHGRGGFGGGFGNRFVGNRFGQSFGHGGTFGRSFAPQRSFASPGFRSSGGMAGRSGGFSGGFSGGHSGGGFGGHR
jgi:hypothetical protein